MLDFTETGNLLWGADPARDDGEAGEKELRGLEVDAKHTRHRSADVRLNWLSLWNDLFTYLACAVRTWCGQDYQKEHKCHSNSWAVLQCM